MNYKQQLSKIFELLIANNPYHYRDVDITVLANDWTKFFSDAEIPSERLLDIYSEVIKAKAASSNNFGIVTNVDMLNGWLRIKAKQSDNQQICDRCGKAFNEKAGLYTEYSTRFKKDTVIKCQGNHRKC